MAVLTSDQIGKRAELWVSLDLSCSVGRGYDRPLFRVAEFGEKHPTVDFLVDALGPDGTSTGFFFVQVKGTTVPSATRLGIEVPVDRFNRLVAIPAPTYVIGVDVTAPAAYLVGAYRRRQAKVSSISKAYPLGDDVVIIRLYREVLGYWRQNRPTSPSREFRDE
jgi:hypothetical protein